MLQENQNEEVCSPAFMNEQEARYVEGLSGLSKVTWEKAFIGEMLIECIGRTLIGCTGIGLVTVVDIAQSSLHKHKQQ